VDYLYSLYDALVSINVPNDKARAVVDAMERDMATTIATKTDLQLLRQELVGTLRAESGSLSQDIALIRKEMELLSSRLVIQLGSMLIVGFGLTIASLKFFWAFLARVPHSDGDALPHFVRGTDYIHPRHVSPELPGSIKGRIP